MNSNPFISIVIPTYNRADLIALTIKSLLAQTYSNFEILVIDDGSKDNTEAVVTQFKDKRIAYSKVTNGERGRARNLGTLLAKGDYITFIDSDDIAYSNHFAEAVKMINKYDDPEIFHLAYEMKDTLGNLLFQYNDINDNINQSLLKGNVFSCIGVFLRNDIAKQFLFEEDRRLAGTEDWHLWLKLASRFPIYISNNITACMVNHDHRSVLHFNISQMFDRTKLLVKYLSEDSAFLNAFGSKGLKRIEAHMFTYIALHSILSKNNSEGWRFFIKGIIIDYSELFQRRSLAILKHSLLNFLR